jgi:hypothetical protein
LALLQQRCSDKSAAVRGKALSHLAAVVRSMLGQAGAGDAHMLQCRQARFCCQSDFLHFFIAAHSYASVPSAGFRDGRMKRMSP